MAEKQSYNEAIRTGQYAKRSGLTGKYDNVRRFWEDEVVRCFVRPMLKDLVQWKTGRGERISVLDLGCGAGDGYGLLTGITDPESGMHEHECRILGNGVLGDYMGIDINPDLLAQAGDFYGNLGNVRFEEGDFSDGLPVRDRPFDVYFTSYGTLSHNCDRETVRLLGDIASCSGERAIVICEWLGRYSYEWQDIWSHDRSGEAFINYRISYVYPPEERDRVSITSFPLRMMAGDEVTDIIGRAGRLSGRIIETRAIFDKSLLVGRHMDTAEYNRSCPPMRERINALFEPDTRTDLSSLVIDYVPRDGFDELNDFFERFTESWNMLVLRTRDCLTGNGPAAANMQPSSGHRESLAKAVGTIESVIAACADLSGDPRAGIVEPLLACLLRQLEVQLQQGLGAGHGLVAVLEIT